MQGFKNSRVYVEGRGIVKTSLGIENGKFVSFREDERFPQLDDKYTIIPGLIDEHTHGGAGFDFMDADEEGIRTIGKNFLQDGVVAYLATTMTMEKERIEKALKRIGAYTCSPFEAQLLGIHLEGPFISPSFCGAQDPENILKPETALMERWIRLSSEKIRLVTFAPEGAEKDFYELLEAHRIVKNAGHTAASAIEAEQAILRGLNGTTHTYNAMKGIHHRDIGTTGTALLNDSLYCEIIADRIHVSDQAIALLLKCKPKEKVILITDSMEAKYLSAGKYALGGQEVFVDGTSARLKDGTLAGSILRLNVALKNIRDISHLPLTDVVDMASINPARNLGIQDRKGSISLGKDADFVIIDEDFDVYATYIAGKEVYRKEITK